MGELYDLYDYSYTSVTVGGWDLMAPGVWDGYCRINSTRDGKPTGSSRKQSLSQGLMKSMT